MIANHSMAAINTLTQLSKNQSSLSKSLAKLSQSMIIDRSADVKFSQTDENLQNANAQH